MGGSHRHRWRETIWSLEGPLAFLVECQVCVRSVRVQPRKRLRKAPEGMTNVRFQAYIQVAEAPELTEALRDRLRSATDKQMGDAWQKGILVPLPTFENLDEYRARNAERMEAHRAAA